MEMTEWLPWSPASVAAKSHVLAAACTEETQLTTAYIALIYQRYNASLAWKSCTMAEQRKLWLCLLRQW